MPRGRPPKISPVIDSKVVIPTRNKKPFRLSDYRGMKIWTGTNVAARNRFLEELYPDNYANWSEGDLTKYVRKKYGNIDLHVKMFANNPRRIKFFIPAKQQWAEHNGENAQSIQQLIDLEKQIELLKDQNALLAEQLNFGDQEKTFELDEDAPQEKSFFEQNILPVLKPLSLPLSIWAAERIAGIVGMNDGETQAAMQQVLVNLLNLDNVTTSPKNNMANNAQTTAPRAYAANEDEYDIPDELLDFFDRVDWQKTDWKRLLKALEASASLLGIHMKPGR